MIKKTEMNAAGITVISKNKKSRKKRITKTALALTLAAGMLFGSVNLPAFAGKNVTIGAQNVLAAGSQTVDLDKLIKNLTEFQKSINSMDGGNLTFRSLVDGAIGKITQGASIYTSGTLFLKMAGIMKDPTSESLMKIQYTLNDMNTTIQDMNNALKDVAEGIAELKVISLENARAAEVNHDIDIYNGFKANNLDELNSIMDKYEYAITHGLQVWYKNTNNRRTPVNLYYAYDEEGKMIQVFNYSDIQNPTHSVEGYEILRDQTIHLSKEAVDHAMEKAPSYSVNSIRDDMLAALREEIRVELQDGTLDAGDAFFKVWESLSADEKKQKLDVLAEEAYNAISSEISREEMENSSLSNDAYSKFKAYCEAVPSVLNAEINILKLTHGFEGEVRDKIEKLIDSVNLTTGIYANMTLTMMHQNSCQSNVRIKEILDAWTKVTENMTNTLDTTLTGYDNFCYVTGCLVNYEERTMEYQNSTTTRLINSTVAYKDSACTTGNLLNDNDRIADYTQMTMLAHLDPKPNESKNFSEYLAKQNINFPETGAHNLVAETNGWTDFSPSSGIFMNYGFRADSAGEDYWGKTFQCKVNQGNDSDIEDQYFHNRKIMTGSLFDLKANRMFMNATLGAMATYGENHWNWFRDEVYLMGYADSCDHKVHIYDEEHTYDRQSSTLKMTIEDTCYFKTTYGVLILSEPESKNAAVQASPSAEADTCMLIADISKIQPAVSEVHTYIDVNPNQDKSQLIEEYEEIMDEPVEELVEESEIPEWATEDQEIIESTQPVVENADLN